MLFFSLKKCSASRPSFAIASFVELGLKTLMNLSTSQSHCIREVSVLFKIQDSGQSKMADILGSHMLVLADNMHQHIKFVTSAIRHIFS